MPIQPSRRSRERRVAAKISPFSKVGILTLGG
jgi:hypothetical protein